MPLIIGCLVSLPITDFVWPRVITTASRRNRSFRGMWASGSDRPAEAIVADHRATCCRCAGPAGRESASGNEPRLPEAFNQMVAILGAQFSGFVQRHRHPPTKTLTKA